MNYCKIFQQLLTFFFLREGQMIISLLVFYNSEAHYELPTAQFNT